MSTGRLSFILAVIVSTILFLCAIAPPIVGEFIAGTLLLSTAFACLWVIMFVLCALYKGE